MGLAVCGVIFTVGAIAFAIGKVRRSSETAAIGVETMGLAALGAVFVLPVVLAAAVAS